MENCLTFKTSMSQSHGSCVFWQCFVIISRQRMQHTPSTGSKSKYASPTADSRVYIVDIDMVQGCQLTVTWPGPDSEPASPTRPSGNLDGLYRDDHSISVNCQPEPELRNVMGRLSIGPRRTTREALCDHSVHSPSYSRLSPTGRSAVPQNEPISKWGQNHELPGPLTPRRRERPDSFPPSHNETRYFDDCYYPPSLGAWDVHGAIGQERGLLRQPNYHAGRFSPNRRSNMRTGGRHDHDYTSGHHNVVDVERIRRGLDVRTTARAFLISTEEELLIPVRSCCATYRTKSTR